MAAIRTVVVASDDDLTGRRNGHASTFLKRPQPVCSCTGGKRRSLGQVDGQGFDMHGGVYDGDPRAVMIHARRIRLCVARHPLGGARGSRQAGRMRDCPVCSPLVSSVSCTESLIRADHLVGQVRDPSCAPRVEKSSARTKRPRYEGDTRAIWEMAVAMPTCACLTCRRDGQSCLPALPTSKTRSFKVPAQSRAFHFLSQGRADQR